MTVIQGRVGAVGKLKVRKIKNRAPLSWRLRNALRFNELKALFGVAVLAPIANFFGITTMTAKLSAIHIDGRTGKRTSYGVVSRRVVTTAFVNYLVDIMQVDATTIGDFLYHDSGVGVTGPAVGDTDIETTDGEARASGSQTEGASANIYKSVGTITYTTTKAITEHGLFNASTGPTLLDRSTFTAINVVNTDQIEFTYELTVSAGG